MIHQTMKLIKNLQNLWQVYLWLVVYISIQPASFFMFRQLKRLVSRLDLCTKH